MSNAESAQNLQHAQPTASLARRKIELHKALQTGTLVTALATTAIGLVGYGVGAAAEQLGASQLPLISSPLDAFALFTQGAPRMILATSRALDRWWESIPLLWLKTLPLGIVITFVLLVFFFARPLVQARRERKANEPTRSRTNMKPWAANVLKLFVSLFGGAVGGMLLPLTALFAVEFAITVVALLPMVGYSCGELHIAEAVVKPKICAGTYNRAQLVGEESGRSVTKPTAFCVEVRRDQQLLGEGRVVFATPSKILLFGPRTGTISLIPTDGAIVAVVGSLREEQSVAAASADSTETP